MMFSAFLPLQGKGRLITETRGRSPGRFRMESGKQSAGVGPERRSPNEAPIPVFNTFGDEDDLKGSRFPDGSSDQTSGSRMMWR